MDIYNKVFLTGLISATLLSTANTAGAVSITSDLRQVNISGEVGAGNSRLTWSEQTYADSNDPIFNHTLSTTNTLINNTATSNASISSNVSSNGSSTTFSGTGDVYSYASTEGNSSDKFRNQRSNTLSEFEIRFTLTESANFNLTGSLFYDEVEQNSPYGGAYFSLRNSSYNTPAFNLTLGSSNAHNDFNQTLQLAGLLGPGTYYLEAFARANTDAYSYSPRSEEASAGFDFNFTLDQALISSPVTQVPVPAAAWLFGSALLGLAGAKRKQ